MRKRSSKQPIFPSQPTSRTDSAHRLKSARRPFVSHPSSAWPAVPSRTQPATRELPSTTSSLPSSGSPPPQNRPNLQDTIRRLQSFADAGADVLYAPGLPSLEAICEVCASVSKPVNALIGATFSVEELAAAGVKRISVGGSFARAALGAF